MEEIKPYEPVTETADLFAAGEFVEYTEATTTQRFVNYLIDMLLVRFGLIWVTSTLIVQVLSVVSPEAVNDLANGADSGLIDLALVLLTQIFYYTICEKAFRGYTLGKLITGTRSIREDGDELTMKDALLRSLSRLVPLEAISIWFGRGPWHDTWTKTKVIQSR
jgi:uncharacterized RDD family membrane protein YckC